MTQDDKLTAILERVIRVEERVLAMADARDTAREALEQAKSAHKRLNRVEKVINWVGTTVVGAVILGLLGMLFKSGK